MRADVARIIELYKRQGRFGAEVEPKMVLLDQNRVDIVSRLPKAEKQGPPDQHHRQPEAFRTASCGVMLTKQAAGEHLRRRTSWRPRQDGLRPAEAAPVLPDQGYADFRVVSAVAELTPDKKDFIITYVVEEGKRFKFGDVKVESQLRDFDGDKLADSLPMKKGEWYNAKMVEDTIDRLTKPSACSAMPSPTCRPNYERNPKTLTMGLTFQIGRRTASMSNGLTSTAIR